MPDLPAQRSEPVDVLIITALPEERDALLALLPDVRPLQMPGCPTYYVGCAPTADDPARYRIAVTMLPESGNAVAAVHTSGAIHELCPISVWMVGISAGLEAKTQLGDVIVAKHVWYYELAKQSPRKRQPRPGEFPADPVLLDRAENLPAGTWLPLLSHTHPEGAGDLKPRLHFGHLAAGDKVVADEAFLTSVIGGTHPKVIGVEMESFGVALAAAHGVNRPRFLAIRGVSDFANAKKDDRFHTYAAASAAAFVVGLLRCASLPRHDDGVTPSAPAARRDTLIGIRHQSKELIQPEAIRPALPPTLANCDLRELVVDQTDLCAGGLLNDPLLAARRQADLPQRLREALLAFPNAQVAYYGIAHVPLLFLAGYSLSHRAPMHFFELNRATRQWDLLSQRGAFPPLAIDGLPDRVRRAPGDAVLRISVSYRVDPEDVAAVVPNPLASIHLRLHEPRLDAVTSLEQVDHYAGAFRRVLDKIHKCLPGAERLHVFYAGPVALALNLGRHISPTVDPLVLVYNYTRRATPRYAWAYAITAELGSPEFYVTPGHHSEV